eukprot:CAMPEP_0119337070 /NCGR_PEP_ID=MMETSP1333-20130426/93212_1 /TAXON_ID=418940 /ORGANISM="Scyphosphaera apsteinii, Strain RCC1455" /LENGTH=33 /DNA_ID= /DNA_START= /DNA_END= /DNA_ORIENTATION=
MPNLCATQAKGEMRAEDSLEYHGVTVAAVASSS